VKSVLLKRSLIAGAVAITSVASYIPMINAASADVIAASGSDTTENVMGSILSQLNTLSNPTYNVPVYGTSNFSVPGDAYCPDNVFYRTIGSSPIPTPVAPGIAAPNGSGAGRNALRDYVGSTKRYTDGAEVLSSNAVAYAAATPVTGCTDIARSSSFSSGSPAATKGQYFGFALDSVSWASPSSKAPANLTLAQIQGIYNCTFTDWSEVGGSAGPIQRYLPPTASGTRQFFQSDLLGLSTSYNSFTSNASCPAVKVVDKNGDPFEENRGDRIPDSDIEKAILPYSAGQWVYQANNAANPSIDQRKSTGGTVTQIKGINRSPVGKGVADATDNVTNNTSHVAYNTIDGRYQLNDSGWATVDPTPDAAGYPVKDTNYPKEAGKTYDTVDFPGVRIVFNVLHSDSPSYGVARGLVGFNNIESGTKSTLCSGGFKSTISAYGFSPLTSTANGTSNLAGSTCRRYLA
jgi:ABC-type phosphate transport system substrate-binding protein